MATGMQSVLRAVECDLTIADDMWEPTGSDPADQDARLLATIRINGTFMHLEAWAVATEEQEATDACISEDLEALQNMMDCRFHTTTIKGRTYVLIATPFGA